MYKMPGAPTPASVNAMQYNAELGEVNTSKKYQWQTPYASNQSSNEFPIVPVPKDSYDDVANIKAQYAKAADVGENWVVPFDQADAQYLVRKRNAEEKAEFDTWVMQKYDITDPAQNLMLQRIAPELFARREEVIDNQQELVSRYAKARLRGAQSLSDLELEWLIETRRLDLPKGPIWDPKAWRAQQSGAYAGVDDAQKERIDRVWNQDRYYDGLFSPIKWLTRATSGWQPSNDNPADIRGDQTRHFESASVPFPGSRWANAWAMPAPFPYAGANAARTMANAPMPYGDRDARQAAVDQAYRGAVRV